jgi:hypothetical protein
MGQTIVREKNPQVIEVQKNVAQEKLISFTQFKEVRFGEGIYLIGNHPNLGSLDIKNAIRLKRDEKHPFWRTEIALEPNDYFYRFFVGGYDNLNENSIKPLTDFYWPLKTRAFDYLEHESCFNQGNIRTISFNLRYDNRNDKENLWENRESLVCETIFKYLPDILSTQEGLPNQINDVYNKILSLYEYWGIPREVNGESSGIFYRRDKFVFVDGGHFWLSDTPEKSSKTFGNVCIRICSWIRLKYSNKNFFKK